MSDSKILKKDLFGEIRLEQDAGNAVIVRDTRPAALGLRWIARKLMRREAAALAQLSGIDGFAEIVRIDDDQLLRSHIEGMALHHYRPDNAELFKQANKLRRKMQRAGVAHNDLAKEPNILVRRNGAPAFIDFQMALHSNKRGKIFRIAAREDLRHLLKHKRYYCPDALTGREIGILENPSVAARIWRSTVKPVYTFVTRRLLRWSDREGAGDRGEAV